ncbi:hypothetical protein MAHJHV59_14400 [Mycobacterium avium subsp. hominissuis]
MHDQPARLRLLRTSHIVGLLDPNIPLTDCGRADAANCGCPLHGGHGQNPDGNPGGIEATQRPIGALEHVIERGPAGVGEDTDRVGGLPFTITEWSTDGHPR